MKQELEQPQINMERVRKAVENRKSTTASIIRPKSSNTDLRPIDADRRRVIPAKGDNHLFVGILAGGVIHHD